jgi:hypothetical protein
MTDQEAPATGAEFLVRIYWLFLGNTLLLFLLVLMSEKRPKLPSITDAAYLAAVASLIAVRYVDIRFLNGQTGEGKPATMSHWRRYALLIGSIGAGAWLVVRLLIPLLK